MDSVHWTPTAQSLLNKRTWVLGYVAEDYPNDQRALASIRQYGNLIDVSADFAFLLHADGTFSGRINEAVFTEDTAKGIAPLILFHNFSGDRFDPYPVHTVLSSPYQQQTCLQNMLSLLPPDAAGVHLDFENIDASYRTAYVSFLESAEATFHSHGLLLTAAVPAKRSEWEAPGYDFGEIGRFCDAVTVMTYDEHFAGGTPGPVASLPWMTQALDYAIQFIPRQKMLVGIPVYGYDWSSMPTRMIPMQNIPDLVRQTGARVLWSDQAVEPYFYYWQGRERHTVWFESEISSKTRLGFVKSYRLRGIAIWRLGYETNRFWQGISQKLKK